MLRRSCREAASSKVSLSDRQSALESPILSTARRFVGEEPGHIAYSVGPVTRPGNRLKGRDRQPGKTPTPKGPQFDRIDVATATLVGCGSLILFVATLCPTIYVEDSPEFSTAAAVLGLPHPPGYPLHTLLSALFVHAVPFGDFGYRSNLFSAICGALALALLWVFLRRLHLGRSTALTATFCLALGTTFWSQCLAAEVHTLNCLLLVSALLLVFEAAKRPTPTSFALSGMALGLLVGHRNLNVVFAAPLVFLLEAARRRVQGRARLLVTLAGAAAMTGLIYLYLPLTARRDPPLDMGAPSTLQRFYTVVSAQPYFRHFATAPAAVNWNRLGRFLEHLPATLGIGALAAPVGFVVWRRRGDSWPPLCFASIAISCIGFSSLYNVIDVDSYFLPATLALAVLAAFGVEVVRGRLRLALPLVALASLPLHFASVDLHGVTIAHTYGRDLFQSAPKGAALISFGDTTTHVLWYEQAVEHLRPDVTVVSFDEIADWYVDQLARRHPDVVWPVADVEPQWLSDFVERNSEKRTICLTQPLDLGLPGWQVLPEGLLFCLRRSLDVSELATSVKFWEHAVVPSAAGLVHSDVHVQMIAFSYAASRFALARAFSVVGDFEEARTHLRAVVAADPDRFERAIAEAMQTIGRVRHSAFDFGRRASQALLVDPRNRDAIVSLLRP